MSQFSQEAHTNALLRRRIKFVVEKGAIARLFKRGTSDVLQAELFHRLRPTRIATHRSRDDYDAWLIGLIKEDCWGKYSRNGLDQDRWAYFAKLLNIIIYEIVSNRELVSEDDWQKLRPWLHVPLDASVFFGLTQLDPSFPARWVLKGMTEKQYWEMQNAIRAIALVHEVPPIWSEDFWTS